MKWLQEEKQTFSLDTGNIKLTYNSVSSTFVFMPLPLSGGAGVIVFLMPVEVMAVLFSPLSLMILVLRH